MIKYYELRDGVLTLVKNPQDVSGLTWCDVHLDKSRTSPNDELKLVSTMFKINIHDLKDTTDLTERPRYNYDMLLENQFMLLRGIMSDRLDLSAEVENPTIPIGIFYTIDEKIVTVHSIDSPEFTNIIDTLDKRNLTKPIFLFLEFIQIIFNRLDRVSYNISLKINEIQKHIGSSRDARKRGIPFKLNSYMIFFNAAMMGNYNAFQAFMDKNKSTFEADAALYEKVDDLKIDIKQIYQFTSIYRDQVNNLVEQANNIINNNLNNIFKVVGSISLLVSIPTLIASFYGMNVGLPGGIEDGNFISFYIIMGISFTVSFVTWLFFRKLDWL